MDLLKGPWKRVRCGWQNDFSVATVMCRIQERMVCSCTTDYSIWNCYKHQFRDAHVGLSLTLAVPILFAITGDGFQH